MNARLLIPVAILVAAIAVAVAVAPRPAHSQGYPQPVSISMYGDANSMFVLYDNGEVWQFHWTSEPLDVSYPGISAAKATSWGKVKSGFADE